MSDTGQSDQLTFASEPHGFLVTRAELELLARHYAEKAGHWEAFMYVVGQAGRAWLWEMQSSYRRLDEIDSALGGGIAEPLLAKEWAKNPHLEAERASLREHLAMEDSIEQFLADTPEGKTEMDIDAIEGNATLRQEVLKDLVKKGRVVCQGEGGPANPPRYYLPERRYGK